MYIAVCDDQKEELNALVALLELWQKERRVTLRIRTFTNASELLDCAKKEQFTLYLLDIMMSGTDGLEAAREIRGFDDTAQVVFLTSSPGFAYESYSVHALDYLLKPIRAEKLFPIIDRLALEEQNPTEGLTLKCGGTLVRILLSQLSYVEVSGKHLFFHLTDGSIREVAGSMSDYEQLLLEKPEFMRPHRSYIVNMLQAAEFSTEGIRMFSGQNLPVSRLLFPKLQKAYMKLLFSERKG
ncbi:MAG: response regulator transcription factor [Ruminococcaceae bacterium]|nr:response regulator transcription factor [Oscillospiraceae bacterium]